MSDMRLVQNAVRLPHHCAAIPFIGQNHAEGYIDTGAHLDGLQVYISVVAVKEMAKMIRWVPVGQVVKAQTMVEGLEHQLELANQEIDRLGLIVDAVDVIESADFTRRKKPGRPKREEVEA